jgi:hypothetical protein
MEVTMALFRVVVKEVGDGKATVEVHAINNQDQGIPTSALFYLGAVVDLYRSALENGDCVGLAETLEWPKGTKRQAKAMAKASPCNAVLLEHAIEGEDDVDWHDDRAARKSLLTFKVGKTWRDNDYARAEVRLTERRSGLLGHLIPGSMVEVLYGWA